MPVNGELTILGETSASLLSSHGACGSGEDELAPGRSYSFACRGIRLELITTGGTATGLVSVPAEQEYEHRGGCIAWQTDPQKGQRQACTS